MLTFRSSVAFAESQFRSKFVPPEGKVLLIVGQDKSTIEKYHKKIGITPGGVMCYTSIQKMEGIYRPKDNGAGDHHAQWLADQFPNSILQIGLYMVDALDMVVTGIYDENIEKLAKFFNDHDRPFFLRIGYEFDSPENNYIPEKYIEAYRYIVNRLNDLGVKNVAYVWHAHGPPHKRPHMDWYPGDTFVDWVGLSYFSPYNTEGMERIFLLAKRLNKPVMIAESTPIKLTTKDGEDTWKRWFRFIFKHIDEYDIKAFSYINSYWDVMPMFAKDEWGDARIEKNEYIMNQWKDAISKDSFLNASDELFELLDYQSKQVIPE